VNTAVGPAQAARRVDRTEALAALAYFGAYFGFLLVRLESEWEHWLGLVLVPIALLLAIRRFIRQDDFVGERTLIVLKPGLRRGLLVGISAGLLLAAMQTILSDRRDAIMEIVRSGNVIVLFPMAVALMIATAATTEEVFFRGILLSRVLDWSQSRIVAVGVSAVAFGLYHFPYAYLHPNWPSHGQ
jgi:membrane protease YdiL (CAAX protease family)